MTCQFNLSFEKIKEPLDEKNHKTYHINVIKETLWCSIEKVWNCTNKRIVKIELDDENEKQYSL